MMTTASMNGVIKIAKRSMRKFQFGDDQPVVEFDVIAVYDQWHQVNFALRVKQDDDWIVPADKVDEFGLNRLNFVQALLNDAYPEGIVAPTLTRSEAEEFIKQVQNEAAELRNFIYPKSDETSSAPESTEQETRFSQ